MVALRSLAPALVCWLASPRLLSAAWPAALSVVSTKSNESKGEVEETLADTLRRGSLNGFLTYKESQLVLGSWLREHPDVLRSVDIGRSFEGRPLTAYVLGKGSGRPQVLISSLIHAREPAGLSALLYSFGTLLKQYQAGDPLASYLVRGREIWFIPFVNPDGYVANELQPLMHRMHRKNMRDTGCSDKSGNGVDLNRNFDEMFQGGGDVCSDTYAGAAAFSEPETAAIRDLVLAQSFKTAFNFHSYGHFLTHPYNFGRKDLPAEVQAAFDELGRDFEYQAAEAGPAIDTVGYTTSGESDDWFFAKGKVLSMSPEVGHEFWPSMVEVQGIQERNYPRTQFVALKAGLELAARLDGKLLTLTNRGMSASTGGLVVAVGAAGAEMVGQVKSRGGAVATSSPGANVTLFQLPVLHRRGSWLGELDTSLPGDVALCVMERAEDVLGICQCSGPDGSFFVDVSGGGSRPGLAVAHAKAGSQLCKAALEHAKQQTLLQSSFLQRSAAIVEAKGAW